MSSDERTETVQLLRAIGCHLHAIIILVETGIPCGQVLSELCALKAELQSLKMHLLDCQVNASKNGIQHDPCIDRRIVELQRLVDLYTIKIQST